MIFKLSKVQCYSNFHNKDLKIKSHEVNWSLTQNTLIKIEYYKNKLLYSAN